MKSVDKRVSKFEKILSDIKLVKIQGAENIARAGIQAYALEPNEHALKRILSTRPTEPLMQNGVNLIHNARNKLRAAQIFLSKLRKDHENIARYGADLIRNDMNVYVHCHSSTVMDILKYAKLKNKKHFVVYTTEVEPLLQGHLTAKDLAKAKIKVIVSPDLYAEKILSKCDILLFGADAYTKSVVANKIGTSTLVRLAKYHRIPRYSCGVTLKFTKKLKLEERPSSEVWDERENKIQVINPAFDVTRLDDLTGIICEQGIVSPKTFVRRAKESLRHFQNFSKYHA